MFFSPQPTDINDPNIFLEIIVMKILLNQNGIWVMEL